MSLSIQLNQDGLKISQEKYDFAEILQVKKDLFDEKWHQITISVQNGDIIIVHIDCKWESTYILSKGFITLPDEPEIELGDSFDGFIDQLILMHGSQLGLQCSGNIIPINDQSNNLLENLNDRPNF